MSWFKFNWFSSKEREELQMLREQNEKLAAQRDNLGRQNIDYAMQIVKQCETGKPYKNIYFSNGNVTVIFHDGTMLSKSGVDLDFLERVKSASNQKEIYGLMTLVPIKEDDNTKQQRELVSKNLGALVGNSEFEVLGNKVFLKGVNLELPPAVTASFIEIVEKAKGAMASGANRDVVDGYDEQFNALKMFWLKLALNPLPQSREDLLVFVTKNDVRITRNGNLVLYRRIVDKGKGGNKELVTFVSQEYYKVKKAKEDPREFAVVKVGKEYARYHVSDVKKGDHIIGNLQVLYLDLPDYEDNDFTSWHNRGKHTIKIGGIYKIKDDEINLNNGICAAGGLHAAAVDYNYSGFGDTPVVVLVNPSKAITVPLGETGKLRTTEMFIAAINDKPHGQHFDDGDLSAFDEEYHDFSLQELEDAASKKSFEGLAIKDEVPAVSLVDLATIRALLKDRVQSVV